MQCHIVKHFIQIIRCRLQILNVMEKLFFLFFPNRMHQQADTVSHCLNKDHSSFFTLTRNCTTICHCNNNPLQEAGIRPPVQIQNFKYNVSFNQGKNLHAIINNVRNWKQNSILSKFISKLYNISGSFSRIRLEIGAFQMSGI